MLTITASWGIMKQECPFWSTSPNYFVVLRGPLNSSLFKQERAREREAPLKPLAFTAKWFFFCIFFFANCKTSQQKTGDSRHAADLPLRDSVIKACSSSQCSDPMPHYKLGKWYSSSHRVGGMRAHLTSAHVRPEQLMMCRCRSWGETACALWAIRWMTHVLLLMQMCNKHTRQQPWGTNEWLRFCKGAKSNFFCAPSLCETRRRGQRDRYAVWYESIMSWRWTGTLWLHIKAACGAKL